MIDILLRQLHSIGGPVLVALLAVSVIATATAVFKLLSLSRLGVGRHKVARDVLQRWTAGDASGAYQLAAADRAALSQVVGEAINGVWRWPNDKDRAREMATGTALSLLDVMSRHVRVLDTSVQAAPMLGLLGTVLGMIAAFNEMSPAAVQLIRQNSLVAFGWRCRRRRSGLRSPSRFTFSQAGSRVESSVSARQWTRRFDSRLRPGH